MDCQTKCCPDNLSVAGETRCGCEFSGSFLEDNCVQASRSFTLLYHSQNPTAPVTRSIWHHWQSVGQRLAVRPTQLCCSQTRAAFSPDQSLAAFCLNKSLQMAAGKTGASVGGGSSLSPEDAYMCCFCPAVHSPKTAGKSCLLNFWEAISSAF